MGPLGFRVPHFQRYYGSLRLLAILPAALRTPSLGGTTGRRLAMWAGSDASLPAQISTGLRTASFRGDIEASQVPGEPLCACPCSRDPGEARYTKTLRCTGVAFQKQHAVGPRGSSCSRGSVTEAYTLAVYASQHGSPQCHARLASSWLPSLGWAGVVPAGLHWKFQCLIIPFLQALPGASCCTNPCRPWPGPHPRKLSS